jgi:hypothetical protein
MLAIQSFWELHNNISDVGIDFSLIFTMLEDV